MKTDTLRVDTPKDSNTIIGIAHFIKTVEDLHEALVSSMPNIKFGLAFCESSGPCLVRHSGNDGELEETAAKNALNIGAGHSFIIHIRNAYPINVLRALREVPELCSILCATANPIQVITAETEQGRGILGIVDGAKPKGIETSKDAADRKEFLRKIGYKL